MLFGQQELLQQRKPLGPKRTACTSEDTERVRAAVLQSPRRLVRKHVQALQIDRSVVRHIINRELKFHPYKLATVQQLKPADYRQQNLPKNCSFYWR